MAFMTVPKSMNQYLPCWRLPKQAWRPFALPPTYLNITYLTIRRDKKCPKPVMSWSNRRGLRRDIADVKAEDLDGLVMPGGFGTAKNITKWAFEGPNGPILDSVKNLIIDLVRQGKPIAGLCMSPTTIAKALEGTEYHAHLSVGTPAEASPYDIAAISAGMESIGQVVEMTSVRDIVVDKDLKIITAPCYMMEASIVEVRENIKQAVEMLISLA
jgi:enhancing lycopene biosynthesis protein 2